MSAATAAALVGKTNARLCVLVTEQLAGAGNVAVGGPRCATRPSGLLGRELLAVAARVAGSVTRRWARGWRRRSAWEPSQEWAVAAGAPSKAMAAHQLPSAGHAPCQTSSVTLLCRHWSLLMFHRPSNTLRHYDSSPVLGNERVARRLAAAVGPALACAGDKPSFLAVAGTPAQANGYDCGVSDIPTGLTVSCVLPAFECASMYARVTCAEVQSDRPPPSQVMMMMCYKPRIVGPYGPEGSRTW